MILTRSVRSTLKLADEAGRRFNHQIFGQMNRLSPESADRLHRLQQIPTIGSSWASSAFVIALVQVVDRVGTGVHAEPLGVIVEDLLVDVARRRVDADLVPDAAQEGVVDQVLGIE